MKAISAEQTGKDYRLHVISRDGRLRGLACSTTTLVREVCQRHGTSPTASAALGRALTAAALMGGFLKSGQSTGLSFAGDGPLRRILVEADSEGSVRGSVAEPAVHLPQQGEDLDVGGAVGRNGLLTVTRDLGLKDPYIGTVQLVSGKIDEDLAYYLTESEQVPSVVGLGVVVGPDGEVSAAGGFLIQTLPPAQDLISTGLMAQIAPVPSVTELLRQGSSPQSLLEHVLKGVPFTVLESRDLAFSCPCSRERIERILITLGRDDLGALLAEQGGTAVTCEFCREIYRFSGAELELLLVEIDGTSGDR